MKRLLFAWALIVSFLPGCQQREPTAATAAQATSTAEAGIPEDGGIVVRRLDAGLNTLNMAYIGSDSEKQVLSYILDPLVDVNKSLEVVPAIAESWEISPDGRVYTFHLDKAATFSDGKPVQANDVLYTIRLLANPATEAAQFSGYFDTLDQGLTKALDPYTVQIGFKAPRASQMLAFNIGILPEHFYTKGNFKEDFSDRVMGSGPYTLTSWDRGKQIVLDKRKIYWRTKPFVDRVIFKVITDDTVAWKALKLGDIDESDITSDQWKFERSDALVQKAIDLRKYYTLGYNFIPWNEKNPILADKRMRRALSMCLDRTSIINNVYFGTARIITGPFTPDQWAYNSDVPAIPYDPQQARRILASLGFHDSDGDGWLDKDKKPLSLDLLVSAGNATSILQAQIFQDALKSIGVKLNVVRLDGATMIGRVIAGKYDGAMLAWNLDLDPDVYSYFHSSQVPPHGQNVTYYSNPQVDRLIEASRGEFDQKKRAEIYHQLHALLAEDQPYTWIVQVSLKWGVSRRIHGVELAGGLGPYEWFPGPYSWWIPKGQQTRKVGPAAP
ncbi:MAG: ABC transporter substrate-binding protein [Acidobacteriota bacterium]